jgi:hypothetical protein
LEYNQAYSFFLCMATITLQQQHPVDATVTVGVQNLKHLLAGSSPPTHKSLQTPSLVYIQCNLLPV